MFFKNIKNIRTKILLYIILILSIAFLFFKYGNNEAVTKSKALAIISEANKRALVVAKSINRDMENLIPFTLDEENEPEYIRAISNVGYGKSKRQFELTFYYVDEDICEQIVKLVDEDNIIRKISPCRQDPFILTYNTDLSPIDYECNEKGCFCKNGAFFSPFSDKPCQYYFPNKVGNCRQNVDCADNQYCEYSGDVNSRYPNRGICKNKGKPPLILTYYSSTENKDFYKGPPMSYWSIRNFCHAHSMTPVSMKDVKCSPKNKCSFAPFYEDIGRFWVTDYASASDNMAYNIGKNNQNAINRNPFGAKINALCVKNHVPQRKLKNKNISGTKYKIVGKIHKQNKKSETTIYQIEDTEEYKKFMFYVGYSTIPATTKKSDSKNDEILLEVSVLAKSRINSGNSNSVVLKKTVIYKQKQKGKLTEQDADLIVSEILQNM